MARAQLRRGPAGYAVSIDGRECITTLPYDHGVALFGPYEWRSPGRWQVTWSMGLADDIPPVGDSVCARIEVVAQAGTRLLVERHLLVSELARGLFPFTLEFAPHEPCEVEYRVQVTGQVSLDIACDAEVASLDG